MPRPSPTRLIMIRSSVMRHSMVTARCIPAKTPARKVFASSATFFCSSGSKVGSSRSAFFSSAGASSFTSSATSSACGTSSGVSSFASSAGISAAGASSAGDASSAVSSSASSSGAEMSTTAIFLWMRPKSPLEGCSTTWTTASSRLMPSFSKPSATAASMVFAVILTVLIFHQPPRCS